jgi:Spy/CpxP family protein refolding chaperone
MNDKHLRAWFVVFVVAVFMAGAGGGLILDRYIGLADQRNPRAGPRPVGRPGGPGPGAGVPMIRHRLATDLDLTAEQQAKLDAILANRQKRIEQVQSEVRARFESEQREMREEIQKILTPEQRKKFEGWLLREPMPPGMMHVPGTGMGRGRGMGSGPGRGRGPGGGGF